MVSTSATVGVAVHLDICFGVRMNPVELPSRQTKNYDYGSVKPMGKDADGYRFYIA